MIRRYKIIFLAFAGSVLVALPVYSQLAGQYPATSANGNASGKIIATGLFQKVFSAGTRHECSIINNGSNYMYVSEGLGIAGDGTNRRPATQDNSAPLPPSGGSYNCATIGTVLIGQINITGIAGDAFYAAQY